MESQPQITRLIEALKGTNRLSNPKARVVVQFVTTRDCQTDFAVGATQSVTGRKSPNTGDTVTSITDSTGNAYAMTDIVGFSQGAALR